MIDEVRGGVPFLDIIGFRKMVLKVRGCCGIWLQILINVLHS